MRVLCPCDELGRRLVGTSNSMPALLCDPVSHGAETLFTARGAPPPLAGPQALVRPYDQIGSARGAGVGVGGFVRVVGAADQGAGLDVDEAEVERRLFEIAELVGMVVAHHRRVRRRWSKVLADGENLAAGRAQIG